MAPHPSRSSGLHTVFADSAAAFLLLTRIPVFWYRFRDDEAPDFVAAQWAFPLVGLVIGGLGGIALAITTALTFPPVLAASLAVATMVLLTGAMHEDGFGDMLDGFGGGKDPASKAKIMHDSHIGTYAVTGLCLAIIARVGLLVALIDVADAWQLVLVTAMMGAGGRFQVIALLRLYPISTFAKLAQVTGRPDTTRGILGLALWVVPMMMALPSQGVILCLLVATAMSLWLGKLAVRQIGGLNGDVMGGTILLSEIAILTGSILALSAV